MRIELIATAAFGLEAVVRREIEECRKHNVNPYKIIEHQKMCGIEVIE